MEQIKRVQIQIQDQIRHALSSQVSGDVEVKLEIPSHPEHGDYATPVCFSLAKILRKSPKDIAISFCEYLNQQSFNTEMVFEPLNGFINIKLTDRGLIQHFIQLKHSIKLELPFPTKDERILLEYVSANPTGPLHIGHGRWAVIGDALYRLLLFTGYKVESEFYINDAGNQIVLFRKSVEALENGQAIPENGYHGEYLHDLINSKEKDPVEQILDKQKQVLRTLKVHFDHWFSESTLHKDGQVQYGINYLKNAGLTYEDQGALWFRSTTFGDEKDRVLIKADGALTYFAVDVAYHLNKVERGFDRLINLWGADHHGYVKRVQAAIGALKPNIDREAYLTVIIGQMVSLFRDGEPVRMSKRTGDMISLHDVIDEIGVDATRYFLLQKSSDTHLSFDLELAKKESSENPVFYVQYAHARMSSILKKLSTGSYFSPATLTQTQKDDGFDNVQLDPYERRFMLHCIRVFDVLDDSAQQFQPHAVIQYMFDLAKQFHKFYEHCPIIKADESDQVKRVHILKTGRATLGLCLRLVGISAPDAM